MLKVLTLIFSSMILGSSLLIANDSCEIRFNDKIVFNGPTDHENTTVLLPAKEYSKKGCLQITYKSEVSNKGWNRTFYLNDENDENLKTLGLAKQSGCVSVKTSFLNEIKAKQPIYVYTVSLPNDKNLAATVRVRRIFICKLEWN